MYTSIVTVPTQMFPHKAKILESNISTVSQIVVTRELWKDSKEAKCSYVNQCRRQVNISTRCLEGTVLLSAIKGI